VNIIYLGSYLNHSPRPNLHTKDGARFLTSRRIHEGEELTVDYRTYGARVYGRANHEDDFSLAPAPSTPHRGGNILAHSGSAARRFRSPS
jgi:hypothetical protein